MGTAAAPGGAIGCLAAVQGDGGGAKRRRRIRHLGSPVTAGSSSAAAGTGLTRFRRTTAGPGVPFGRQRRPRRDSGHGGGTARTRVSATGQTGRRPRSRRRRALTGEHGGAGCAHRARAPRSRAAHTGQPGVAANPAPGLRQPRSRRARLRGPIPPTPPAESRTPRPPPLRCRRGRCRGSSGPGCDAAADTRLARPPSDRELGPRVQAVEVGGRSLQRSRGPAPHARPRPDSRPRRSCGRARSCTCRSLPRRCGDAVACQAVLQASNHGNGPRNAGFESKRAAADARQRDEFGPVLGNHLLVRRHHRPPRPQGRGNPGAGRLHASDDSTMTSARS